MPQVLQRHNNFDVGGYVFSVTTEHNACGKEACLDGETNCARDHRHTQLNRTYNTNLHHTRNHNNHNNHNHNNNNPIWGGSVSTKKGKQKCEISEVFEVCWLHTQIPRRCPGFAVFVVKNFDEILDDFQDVF